MIAFTFIGATNDWRAQKRAMELVNWKNKSVHQLNANNLNSRNGYFFLQNG